MNLRPTSTAFSLVETLIVSALFAALSVVFAQFFTHVHGGFFYARAAADVQQGASAVIRNVEQFTLPALRVREEATIEGVDYTSGEDTLILEVPAIDASGAVIAGTVDTVVLYREGNTFMRRILAGSGSARESGVHQVADAVTQLTFSYATENPADASWVQVSVTTHADVKGRTVEGVRTAHFWLRNFSL